MKVKEWLEDELSGSKFWIYILLFAFLSLAVSRLYILFWLAAKLFFVIMKSFLAITKVVIVPTEYYPGFLNWLFSKLPTFVCQWLREETLFRFLPIVFASCLATVVKRKLACFAIVIAISSLGFGLYHSHSHNIIVLQIFLGLLWSIVFLKAGGWNGRYFKAFLASFSVHALYNFFVVIIANFASREWLNYYR